MRKKRVSVFALVKILGLIILALVHIYSIFIYIHTPRRHKSPLDFPNSVWECEYNGATITLFISESGARRGYIDKDGERTYLYVAYDSLIQYVLFDEITEEEFYGEVRSVISSSQTVFDGYFRCTDTRFTIKSKVQEGRELDFWQTEEPITLVFYRVSG